MMNWTIPRRVAAGFAILLLAAVAVGATSLVRLRAVGGHVATLSSNTIPSVIALSQSAASLSLKELEKNLGGALFERRGKKLVLNEKSVCGVAGE